MENTVADTLSRINALEALAPGYGSESEFAADARIPRDVVNIEAFRLPTLFDANKISAEQALDEQLKEVIEDPDHSLKLRKLTWGPDLATFYCDIKNEVIRPYVPASLRKVVFDSFHALSHPGPKVTLRLINQQYVE